MDENKSKRCFKKRQGSLSTSTNIYYMSLWMGCFAQIVKFKSWVFDIIKCPLAHGVFASTPKENNATFSDHHRQHGYGRAQGAGVWSKKAGNFDFFFGGNM